MGNYLVNGEKNKEEKKKIIVLGLDNAGKTSILYSTGIGRHCTSLSTLPFSIEKVETDECIFVSWDIGRNQQYRSFWHFYFDFPSHVIFVIDSSNISKLDEAINEFYRFLNEKQILNLPVLILLNKQDLPNCISQQDIEDKLELQKLESSWFIQQTIAIRNIGIEDGLNWIRNGCPLNPQRFSRVKSAKSSLY